MQIHPQCPQIGICMQRLTAPSWEDSRVQMGQPSRGGDVSDSPASRELDIFLPTWFSRIASCVCSADTEPLPRAGVVTVPAGDGTVTTRPGQQKARETSYSPQAQCLRLCTSTAGRAGSIPGWGTDIPPSLWSICFLSFPSKKNFKAEGIKKKKFF